MKGKTFLLIFLMLALTLEAYPQASAGKKTANKENENSDLLEGVLKKATSSAEKILGPVVDLKTIVVSADRITEPVMMSASPVSIISDKDISQQSPMFMKNIITEEPSVSKTEAGYFGGQTQVRIRGASPNNTLLLIDHAKVYDPSYYDGSFNFAHLSLDNIEQVEVLRGSQSTLYGAGSIGGVINMVSKKPYAPFFTAGFEGGSFGTFNESLNMGGYEKGLHYSFGFSQLNSNGISKNDSETVPDTTENDPYRRSSLAGKVDYEVTDNLTVGGAIRYVFAKYHYDDTAPATRAKRENDELIGKSELFIYSIHVEHEPFDFYDYSIVYAETNTFRENFDFLDVADDWDSGTVRRFDFQNNLHIFDYDTFTIGYEYLEEISDGYSFSNAGGVNDPSKVFARNGALYLQNKLHYKDIIGSTMGMRVDNHSQFGTHATYKVDGFYIAPTGTRVRGVFATGFKAPALYRLNVPANPGWQFQGGNPDLNPERSKSYELGIDQYLFGNILKLSATYFQIRFRDLVQYFTDPITRQSTYLNVAKAKSLGMEYGISLNLFDDKVTIKANANFLNTKDYSTDRELVRVPKDELNININIKPIPQVNLNANIHQTGVYFNRGTDKIKQRALVDLNADFDITKNLILFVKIENLFNKHYQEVRGYGMPGIGAYGGAKAKF